MSSATRGSAVQVSEGRLCLQGLTHEHLLFEEEAHETNDTDVSTNNGQHLRGLRDV